MNWPFESLQTQLVRLPYPELMKSLRQRAEADCFPLIDDISGHYLAMMVRQKNPLRVLELGSGFGYSALFLVSALRGGASLCLCDLNQDQLSQAKSHIESVRPDIQLSYIAGHAMQQVEKWPKKQDFIFLDIDKKDYFAAVQAALGCLSSTGTLVLDNIFLRGRLFHPDGKKEAARHQIQSLLHWAEQVPEVHASLLPLGDGLLMLQKV